jgi:hypothetical protein
MARCIGMTRLLSVELSRNTTLTFIFVFTIITVIDSTIVKFLSYSGTDFSISSNVIIFTSLFFVSTGGCFILLNSLRNSISKSGYKAPLNIRYFQTIIFATQILMTGIILTVILQMIFSNVYSLLLLHASTYLTHASALLFLISLIIIFLEWIRLKRNYIVLLYIISLSLISVSIILSLIYLEYQFSRSFSSERKPYPIHSYILRQENTQSSESLHTAFDLVYLSSFFALWLATVTLLSQYRQKVGRVKYFILVGVPLIYYAFTFEGYLGSVFSPLILNSPVTFGVTYVLTFSATKQVGAFLFSLSFLTASAVVRKEHVRNSLLMSAIGIALLYGSIEITTLQYRLYPPFGLITETLMPLGAYLLFTGIFTSSTNVAQDAQLRRDISKTAKNQLSLLKSIGATQMEKELVKKFKHMEKRAIASGETDEPYQEEEDVKQIVREVLKELNKTKEQA